MSSFDELSIGPQDFSGKVRLFPLPNLVLFPHVMQPLHIFEPRYRCLLEDVLDSDRLIAMAVLAPGWETNYEGRPRVLPMVCLGRVTTYHRLEDGTYNLLLLGMQRARLVREIEPRKPYREAEVALCQDCYPQTSKPAARILLQKLRDAFFRVLPLLPDAQEQMDQLLATDIPLGMLTDVMSFMLEIEVSQKERLLSEVNVHARAEMLLGHLDAIADGRAGEDRSADLFLPRFSAN